MKIILLFLTFGTLFSLTPEDYVRYESNLKMDGDEEVDFDWHKLPISDSIIIFLNYGFNDTVEVLENDKSIFKGFVGPYDVYNKTRIKIIAPRKIEHDSITVIAHNSKVYSSVSLNNRFRVINVSVARNKFYFEFKNSPTVHK